MKVSFPHMGNTVPYRKLLESLGHEVIVPPKPTQKTIDIGVKHSPEFACFPLKVLFGSYLEAIQLGAEAIVTSGGNGPCRAGFYGELHQRMLNNLGYNVEIIVFDEPLKHPKVFIDKLSRLKGKKSWISLINTFRLVWKLIYALDRVEMKLQELRPFELIPVSFNQAWENILEDFLRVENFMDIKTIEDKSIKLLNSIQLKSRADVLNIGIVGEIYVVLEPSINLAIEEVLGKLGAKVERSHYLTHWANIILPKFLRNTKEEEILKLGEKYIKIVIGGHAKQTVGHIAEYKKRGFDGVIHLMPFACIPELVSQSIIPKISQELDIPVLTIAIDEQTGRANTMTRVEAFVDLIRNKNAKSYREVI
jgi:predicted nucleotide-binding protein (sugar kinase/HSP70/actin superfamily)